MSSYEKLRREIDRPNLAEATWTTVAAFNYPLCNMPIRNP
jgi:hypothetical protein